MTDPITLAHPVKYGHVIPQGTRLPDPEPRSVEQGPWDVIEHPSHYTQYPVEVIEITENLNFNRGNAVKYLCRAGHKGDELEDLRKAEWYVKREIERLTRH